MLQSNRFYWCCFYRMDSSGCSLKSFVSSNSQGTLEAWDGFVTCPKPVGLSRLQKAAGDFMGKMSLEGG